MQFCSFYIFWVALCINMFLSRDPCAGAIVSIVVWVGLLLWMWTKTKYVEVIHQLKPFVVGMFIISFVMAGNLTYYILMAPAFLLYLRLEGGNRNEQSAESVYSSDPGCEN